VAGDYRIARESTHVPIEGDAVASPLYGIDNLIQMVGHAGLFNCG
jgi:hypothetical protein